MAYTIPNSMTLESKRFEQIRLGLQGAPNAGKTTAALTFPGIVVADFDNKLSETNAFYAGKKLNEITIIPFYNAEFVDKLKPRGHPAYAPNKRDAFKFWLSTEAPKLQADQTLFIDSWTMLQAAFDQQQGYEPAVTRKGEIDKFVFWDKKLEFSKDVCERLKTLNCHVVVTFHETIERDDEGKPTGKMKPVMQGQFADQIAGHFNNWFRCHAVSKLENPSDSRSKVIGSDFFWQTIPDNMCNCCTQLRDLPRLVPANYSIFAKKPISITNA